MKHLCIVIIVLCLLFGITGCQVLDIIPGLGRTSHTPVNPVSALPKITNWVMTLSILTIAISVVAFLNGSRSALSGVAGGVVALILAITIQRYAHVIAFVGVISAFGFLIWTVWIKHTALKEHIHALGGVNYRIRRINAAGKVELPDMRILEEEGNNLSKRTQTVVRRLNGNNK